MVGVHEENERMSLMLFRIIMHDVEHPKKFTIRNRPGNHDHAGLILSSKLYKAIDRA
jgi:hypothetical protein